MNFLKSKPSKKLLVCASIILLLVSTVVLVLSNTNNAADTSIPLILSFSSTPTPYPLPTRVYRTPSYFTTIFEQIFGKRNRFINPSLIEEDGQPKAENAHFDLYAVNNYLPIDIQWFQKKFDQVYEFVSARLDITISDKVVVTFVPPQSGECAPRGTTFLEQQPIIVIYANRATSEEQILATLAHELGHVFIHQKYANLSDVALTEGMATWAAGDYWEEWKGVDFNFGVKAFINAGTYLPLYQNYYMEKAYDDNSSGCITQRDILLTEFASFLDYLTQNYGTVKLSILFNTRQPELVNNQRVVYPPNYRDVYGLEFNQLEYEWLKTLLQPNQ